MISKEDRDELQIHFDGRYVKREDCDDRQRDVTTKLSNDDKRLAVIETQQKINNWLTLAIASGIVALVIKTFIPGG